MDGNHVKTVVFTHNRKLHQREKDKGSDLNQTNKFSVDLLCQGCWMDGKPEQPQIEKILLLENKKVQKEKKNLFKEQNFLITKLESSIIETDSKAMGRLQGMFVP